MQYKENQLAIREVFEVNGRFLWEEAVGSDGGYGIDDKVVEGAVSRVLQLRDVL